MPAIPALAWPMFALFGAALVMAPGLVWALRERARAERAQLTQKNDLHTWLAVATPRHQRCWNLDLASNTFQFQRRAAGPGAGTPVSGSLTELESLLHPSDLPAWRQWLQKLRNLQTDRVSTELRLRRPHERLRTLRLNGRVTQRDANGRPTRVQGVAESLRRQVSPRRGQLLASVIRQEMREAVCVMQPDRRILAVNPAFTRITGYSPADAIGNDVAMLDAHRHDPDFWETIQAEVNARGRWSGEAWARRKDGEDCLCSIALFVVPTAGEAPREIVAVFSDVTREQQTAQELRYLSSYDTLTNLPNRALLSDRLGHAVVQARREGGRVGVLLLDFDRFKDINDSLGHTTGDRALRAAATRLQDTVGQEQTVARLGADEFAIVLADIATAEDADRMARELIMAFEAPLQLEGQLEVALSPSIGISLYPEHGQLPTDLLKRADTAMYQAKAAGRRTFLRYDAPMEAALRGRAVVANSLRTALDRGELRLSFQPRLSLKEQRVCGVEALLRWESNAHGDVPPGQFIPLAEESGQILEIGEWVLRQACLTLQEWERAGQQRLSMSVNVSALQLLRGDFPQMVERVLADAGVSPDSLELELTESVILADPAQTAKKLATLRRSGVSLAIDDFGTGYSSLAYLRRLPLTTLKIDKEFIRDLGEDPDDDSITTTVIAMAHALGLHVVAEGVENQAQFDFLTNLGCDEIQGYWLAPPMDADRCLAFLREWQPAPVAAALH